MQLNNSLYFACLLALLIMLAGCNSAPVKEEAEQKTAEETGTTVVDNEEQSSSFKSSLDEGEILSQSQVIKILKENGYIGGAGQMEVDGEILHCDFAGKRPSDGATICIQKSEKDESWLAIEPRRGSRGFARW